jgi:uncharacterized membrane protein YkoI
MTKRILVCFYLTLSAMALNVGLGMSANPSGETPGQGTGPKITMLEALKIATELVPGRVVEAELEDEEGMTFYEIEIISGEGMVVEVQVDANSGQIIKQARDGEVAYITVEEAIKSATEFLRWHAVEIELEEEDGKAVYEIKLVNNLGDDQEVEIDALSGKVLEPQPKKQETDKE